MTSEISEITLVVKKYTYIFTQDSHADKSREEH